MSNLFERGRDEPASLLNSNIRAELPGLDNSTVGEPGFNSGAAYIAREMGIMADNRSRQNISLARFNPLQADRNFRFDKSQLDRVIIDMYERIFRQGLSVGLTIEQSRKKTNVTMKTVMNTLYSNLEVQHPGMLSGTFFNKINSNATVNNIV